ncbi:mannose-ethanolamine phosphotransferase gpi13, partial [Coemansia furcata]
TKLAQINEAIELIVDAVDQSDRATALYVFGDHGMDPKGDHGGDSPREVDAALWMYANRAWNTEGGRQRSARVVEQASALVRSEPLGAALDDDLKSGWWANTHLSDDYAGVEARTLRSIPQIDLVSSLALGLGQPIPFNNLGAVIPELFASDASPSGEWGLLRALRLNAAQMMRYVDAYVESSRSHGFSDDALSAWRLMYRRAEASYRELRENGPGRQSQMLAEEGVAAEYYAFLRVVLGTLRQMWAQFDAALIVAGLLVLALTAVALVAVYVRARHSPLEAVVARLWRPAAAGGAVGVVLGRALSVVLVAQAASHMSLLEASAAGLAIGVMATSCALLLFATLDDAPSCAASLWARVCSPAALLNAVAGVLAAMHGLAFVSNSFTFNEDDIVLHLAQTLTLALAALALCSLAPSRSTQQQRAAGWRALMCAAVILVLNRAAAYSTVCREEKLLACTPTFYGVPSASISGVPLAAANVAMVWLVPFAVLRALRRSQSHRAMVARLWVGVGMRVSMGMAAAYWLLDSVDGAAAAHQKPGWADLRIVLARLAVGVALGGGLAAWYASPFCLDVALPKAAAGAQQSMRRVTVLGYGNAFGAAYLVFVTV